MWSDIEEVRVVLPGLGGRGGLQGKMWDDGVFGEMLGLPRVRRVIVERGEDFGWRMT